MLTLSDSGRDRRALHVILDGDDADVVLHARTEVIQGAGGLARLHKLLHGVSLLPIGRCACHSVAGDV